MGTRIQRFNIRRGFGVEFEMVLSRQKTHQWVAGNRDIEGRRFAVAEVEHQLRRGDLETAVAKIVFTETGVDIRPHASWGHDRENNRAWKFKPDSSLSAGNHEDRTIELVSPVLKGIRDLKDVQMVLKSIAQIAYVNRTCGFHVHHDVSDFTREANDFKSVYKIYRMAQPIIDCLVAPSRRHNSFCAPARAHEDEIGRDNQTFFDRARGSSRYQAVNYNSLLVRSTIEFRQHQGTVNWQKAIAWIVFTQCIVEKAHRGVFIQAQSIPSLRKLFQQVGLNSKLVHNKETGLRDNNKPDVVLAFAAKVLRKQYRHLNPITGRRGSAPAPQRARF